MAFSEPTTPGRADAEPPVGSRLPSLTGLRFVAAFGVFGFHVAPYLVGTAHEVVGEPFGQGSCGVSFFFILSGVVLTWSRRPTDTPWRFYRRRFARIYPDYLAAWLLTIAVIGYEGATYYLHAGALSLVLLEAWVPKTNLVEGWNGVSWTLSCEVFFYLVFPYIVGRIEKLRRPLRLVPVLCLPTLTVGIVATVAYPHADPQVLVWLLNFCPLIRICEFVIGISLAVALRRRSVPPVPLWAAGASFVAIYAVVSWSPLHWLVEPALIPAFVLFLVAAAQRDLRGRPTVWQWRPLVRLGERSYAFYLVHQLVIRVWAKAEHRHLKIASALTAVWWLVALLALSILAASILFRVVEVPFERRLRGSPRRRIELEPVP